MSNNINEFVRILINNDILDEKPIKDGDISNMFNELHDKGLITEKELNNVKGQAH